MRQIKNMLPVYYAGKAQRLKQAKEEAQAEIDAYRQERERQYREHEARVCLNKSVFLRVQQFLENVLFSHDELVIIPNGHIKFEQSYIVQYNESKDICFYVKNLQVLLLFFANLGNINESLCVGENRGEKHIYSPYLQ